MSEQHAAVNSQQHCMHTIQSCTFGSFQQLHIPYLTKDGVVFSQQLKVSPWLSQTHSAEGGEAQGETGPEKPEQCYGKAAPRKVLETFPWASLPV